MEDELQPRLAKCDICKPGSVDSDGNAELGTYCPVAARIIVRQEFGGGR